MFCGVHFMAESADILTAAHQQVILPDLNAGCSMADMADLDAVEEAWETLGRVTDVERIVPVTYMNSSAALKAFVGRHGGAVCTSSNARRRAALGPRPRRHRHRPGGQGAVLPRPAPGPQHRLRAGLGAADMGVWNPRLDLGGLDDADVKDATLLLWKGHCSVHQRFRPEHVDAFRAEHPDGLVFIHPECAHEVVEMADEVGSTDAIIRAVDGGPGGLGHRGGTEIHLVKRLADEHPDKTVVSLDPLVCPCSTMFRIDAAHLCLGARGPGGGRGREPHHRRRRDRTLSARVALERMLEIT